MNKLIPFLVIFCLCIGVTLQDTDKKGIKEARNCSDNDPVFRISGRGILVTEANSSAAPPALEIKSCSTREFLRSTVSTRVIPVIYILLLTVGIPANVAILATLVTKIRKVSTAILYCSLAVSDLLLLLSLFFKTHYHLHGNDWQLGEAACRLVTACFYGNLYCSAQTLACISINRYLAVVRPFLYKRLPKKTCAACVTLVVWGVFGAAVIPELITKQSYAIPELNITTCHDVQPLDYKSHAYLIYYNMVLTIFAFLLPLVVNVFCYVQVIRELNKSHCDWGMYIKASSLVFIIFLVCFAPAGILHFIYYVSLSVDGSETLYRYFHVAVCLCCLHSCLDPFLFVLMSKSVAGRVYLRADETKTLSVSA